VPKKLGISGRYPRPSANGELFYADDGVIKFAFADDAAPLAVVGGAESRDTAPLLVRGLDALLPNQNFFFLRSDASGISLRGAYWINSVPPMLTKVSEGPSLLGSPDGLNYSLAISGEAARAWWRTTRADLPGMVSASLTGDGSDIIAVAIDIAVGKQRCRASEMDPTAWVTPDGRLLLFRESIVDEACAHLWASRPTCTRCRSTQRAASLSDLPPYLAFSPAATRETAIQRSARTARSIFRVMQRRAECTSSIVPSAWNKKSGKEP
jgi:hypothetical protein